MLASVPESTTLKPSRSNYVRSHSSSAIQRSTTSGANGSTNGAQSKGRARSSSLMTVTEVGGDEPETVVDRMGVGTNENANWVNAPGMSAAHMILESDQQARGSFIRSSSS